MADNFTAKHEQNEECQYNLSCYDQDGLDHHYRTIHKCPVISAINVSINSMGAHPPPPPGRLSGICHFGEKMLQMPHHGVQQMPHPWGQNISFLRIFEPN
jgi:hypothetical protein